MLVDRIVVVIIMVVKLWFSFFVALRLVRMKNKISFFFFLLQFTYLHALCSFGQTLSTVIDLVHVAEGHRLREFARRMEGESLLQLAHQ